jgi:hypothetical protein
MTGRREAGLCQYWVMSDVMDLVLLRQLVGGVIATLGDHYTHEKLGEACRRPGLPEPPGEDEGTKRQRVPARELYATMALALSHSPPRPGVHQARVGLVNLAHDLSQLRPDKPEPVSPGLPA